MEDLQRNLGLWKAALENKGLKFNLGKTKLMVSGTEGKRLEVKLIHVVYVAGE